MANSGAHLGTSASGSEAAHCRGMVVVGDLNGTGEAQERGIVGETPNSPYLSRNYFKILDLPKSRICLFDRRYVVPLPILVTVIVVL
jgi:hypothetical protein